MNIKIPTRWVNGILTISFLVLSSAYAQATDPEPANEEIVDTFRSHRVIGGLKVKVDKNFTLSTFGALYLGDGPQYKTPGQTNMYAYNGWDFVPGFMMDFGEMPLKIKVASGGDLYIVKRILQKGSEEVMEYRPRWNLVLSRPISKYGSLAWTSRYERVVWLQYVMNNVYKKDAAGEDVFIFEKDENGNNIPGTGIRTVIGREPSLLQMVPRYQYRSALKYTVPAFTDYKISPFISSESFNYYYADTYFSETELGVNFSPVKGLAVTLSDGFQLKFRSGYIIKNHLICLNVFYTLDFSNLKIFNR